ncbi:glycoside hydrolase family 88 protein [Polycladidibacter hongkongensis]|uniref:glycoside hydrolase family 88 protein n=1 Tax=Polycladidibacter hongkongensis TaxID=1647556 RepID=UPI00082A2C39|nr:glycoside hydrolase family 88 protein [Pseudovibrio hongkongensis]
MSNYRSLQNDVVSHIRRNFDAIGNGNPKIGGVDFKWKMCEPGYWVAGFYVGELWLAYQITGDERFKNQARQRNPFFQHLLHVPELLNHDLGFLFSLTQVADYKLTGNREARELALRAAEALRGQYQQMGEFIQAWPLTKINTENRNELAAGRMLIDSFENLALLFWAHQETGIQSFYDVAYAHARTAVKHLIREDGTTFHTFKFDPATQEPMYGQTLQGYADNSCWSRGQSWAVHGLTQIYAYTKDKAFLDAAKKVTDFALANLTAENICPWDYKLPKGSEVIWDSSATAITCAGVAALSQIEGYEQYRTKAQAMLDGLQEHCDLTGNADAEGLLDHGAYFVTRGDKRAMLPYGDYYYFEAIRRLNGETNFFW